METDGTILIANNNSARFYGIANEHIVGKSIYALIPPDKVENAKEKVKAVIETNKTVRFEGTLGEMSLRTAFTRSLIRQEMSSESQSMSGT